MRVLAAAMTILSVLSAPAAAEGERAGEFDYYVLSLSWQPSWCEAEGRARGAAECRGGSGGRGFVLHGLWPQHEEGWPSYCRSLHREATRAQTAAMADVMGSAGLAWHQWKKHGRCSGLSAEDYFRLSRHAWERVARPEVLRELDRAVSLPAEVVEEAFLEADPSLDPDGVTVTCRDGRVQEVRICLTRSLEPRRCGADVRRDCALRDALLPPIR
jgi:ribonuclease T2